MNCYMKSMILTLAFNVILYEFTSVGAAVSPSEATLAVLLAFYIGSFI